MNSTDMVRDHFEPIVAATMGRYGDFDGVCLASIAVSLKRIADATSGGAVAEQFGGFANLAWEMGRSFAAGQRTDR